MRRTFAILAMLLSVTAGFAGTLIAIYPSTKPYEVPGALHFQVIATGLGQQLITYNAPGSRYGWYTTVSDNLERDGWLEWRKWDPHTKSNVYTRISSLGIGYLCERAELRGGPYQAQISVSRWVYIPWRHYLRQLVSR
jgi:hypothetical protein